MSQYVKIKNTEFVRDMNTKAVLNTDQQSFIEFERQRQKILTDKKTVQETKQRLEQIENDMADVKALLLELKQLKDHK